MLLNRTISCCKILQLKLFSSTLSNFKSKMTITRSLTSTESSTLPVFKFLYVPPARKLVFTPQLKVA